MKKGDISSNKVFQVLTYLNADERERLIQYIQSPYFGYRSIFIKMCQHLNDLVKKSAPGFDKHALWAVIAPKKEYSDVNFRKYCSDLLEIVENFIAQENFTHNPKRQKIDTLDFVAQRRVEPLFVSAVKDARQHVEHLEYKTLNDYFMTYEIELQYYKMMNFDKIQQGVRPNIEEISYNLDIFYLIQKMKIFFGLLSRKKMESTEYKIYFENDIIRLLKDIDIDKNLELSIYYHAYLMLLDQNDDNYHDFKQLLGKYATLLPQKESIDLFESVLNYCTRKSNQGRPEFLEEYFYIFEMAIRTGVFIVNGELDPWLYNNFVGIALRLGKMDWIEQFVLGSRHLLPKESGENIFKFNLARIYLYQKKYNKVLSLLQDVEYEDINYNLISKAVLTITYYELREYDALSALLTSFQTFLGRKKSLAQQKGQRYLNLTRFTARLVRLRPGDQAALAQLRADIERERAVTVNHDWLLEKVAALNAE